MGLFAEFDDVDEAFEEDLDRSLEGWVENRIDAAEAILISKVPKLAGDIAETDKSNARRLVVEAVLNVVRNPQGFKTEAAGSFQATRFDHAAKGLTFTAEDLAVFKHLMPKRSALRMVGVAKPWYLP